MAAKRPSTISIRARQVYIIRALETRKLTYEQAGKLFGEKPRAIKHFVETQPKVLRRTINRPTNSRLYEKGAKPRVREIVGLKRITRYEYSEVELQQIRHTPGYTPEYVQKRVRAGERIQPLYTGLDLPRNRWAQYTGAHDLPSSPDVLRLLHRNNRIGDLSYLKALNVWKEIYGIEDDYAQEYYDEVDMQEYREVA